LYCIECGKANPEGAKFCAYCGVKLFTGETVPTIAPIAAQMEKTEASAQPETTAPAKDIPAQSEKAAVEPEAPAQSADAKPYVRVRHGRTLQPTMENPAQPDREERMYFSQPAPESVQPEPEPEPAPEPEMEQWWNDGAKSDAPEAEPVALPDDLWGMPGDEPEEEEPKKKRVFPWQRNRDDNMVLTSSGTEEMPARKPVISRKKRDTRIPERIVKQEEPEENELPEIDDEEVQDIFFMRPKKQRREEEDSIDDAYVNSRVRSILFAIGFVTCLFVAVWLFATNSGQMLLAGFNLSSSAEAYRDLGDSALGNNQVKRAAEAYYKALSLDPDDYDTALLVGKTQQQIGEYDTAADAYYMCTQLRPSAPEPYEALVRLYEIQNEPEKADYFRNLGAANAGLTQ